MTSGPVSRRLPDFPWDKLTAYAATARSHADGVVDLSVGTPVDPTPEVVQEALRAGADAPGYPQTYGTPVLREAVAAWFARRRGGCCARSTRRSPSIRIRCTASSTGC